MNLDTYTGEKNIQTSKIRLSMIWLEYGTLYRGSLGIKIDEYNIFQSKVISMKIIDTISMGEIAVIDQF